MVKVLFVGTIAPKPGQFAARQELNVKPSKPAKRAAYKALPVARIERPLRNIANLTYEFNEKGERIASKQYRKARIAANRGQGHIVRQILAGVQS